MAYGTVGGLAEYAAQQGYEVSVSPAILERATRILDALYGSLFIGDPVSFNAAWPRKNVPGVPSDEIPLRVIEAEYELAIMEAQSPGTFTEIMEASKRGPIIKEKAGEVEQAYADPSKAYGYSHSAFGRPVFIDGLLSPFIYGGNPVPRAYVV